MLCKLYSYWPTLYLTKIYWRIKLHYITLHTCYSHFIPWSSISHTYWKSWNTLWYQYVIDQLSTLHSEEFIETQSLLFWTCLCPSLIRARTHYQILKLLAMLISLTVFSDAIVNCNALIVLFILLRSFIFIWSSLLWSDNIHHKYFRFRRANTIILNFYYYSFIPTILLCRAPLCALWGILMHYKKICHFIKSTILSHW